MPYLRQYTDQMGFTVSLSRLPKRIVSLVPSQTELLYHLGIEPVGQTIFCIHPSSKFKSSTKIGGTKKLNLDVIRALKPDLIIGNKEENDADQINQLQDEFPVWMSDINTIEESYKMIELVGKMTGKNSEATKLIFDTKAAFSRLITTNSPKPTVVYLIWNKPFYGVGSSTFIHDVLDKSGFDNALKNLKRYPELTVEEINEINPDYLFLSSEPYPFKEAHQQELARLCPGAKVVLVDGEMFSWYGSRLQQAPAYINRLISDIRSKRK